jgi:hypothetical protein
LKLNLEFDSQAQSAPAGFEAAMQEAANILDALVVNDITVNIAVGYGELNGNAYTSTGIASASPNVVYQDSYSQVRQDLANNDPSTVTALPNTTSIDDDKLIDIFGAQAKAFGQISATDSTVDGYMGVGTGVPQANWVGVALHELTHAMGRVPGTNPGPDPDIFDLFRFLSPGNRLLASSATPSAAAYFSLDGGQTDLADYGISSDPSDFLNPAVDHSNPKAPASNRTPDDPFNENYVGGTYQYLTNVDLQQLNALGFSIHAIDYWQFNGSASWNVAGDWSTEEPQSSDRVTIAQGNPIVGSNEGAVASITISAAGQLDIDYAGALTTVQEVINNGNLILEEFDYATAGPSLTVGGALFNDDYLQIGNSDDHLGANALLTANGLNNTGTIDLFGGSDDSATLAITAAAGFGTAGVLSGTVDIVDDAAITFASGSISTIAQGAQLTLSGAGAQIADQGGGFDSALSGLTSVAGTLVLQNGASLSLAAAFDVGGAGQLTVSSGATLANFGTFNNYSGVLVQSGGSISEIGNFSNAFDLDLDTGATYGGSSVSVTGSLVNGHDIKIGNATLFSSPDTLTVGQLSNVSTIRWMFSAKRRMPTKSP